MRKKSILIGSPIKQVPLILELFLLSLKSLIRNDFSIAYFFIDDNDDELSSLLLERFRAESEDLVEILKEEPKNDFVRDDFTHHWTDNLVWRVAAHKNRIIEYLQANDFDYLFFVDSDLLLHPNTLVHLASLEKAIVSEIFWTKWQPEMPELPQVWGFDHYTLYDFVPGDKLSSDQVRSRQRDWLEKLRKPGVYRVGGLGACTLIDRTVLTKGVNFSPLYNISFWGEDRHFCLRAVSNGFELFVDTHYPAFHIYRISDLPKAKFFLTKNGMYREVDSNGLSIQLLNKATQALICYGTTDFYKKDLKFGLEFFVPETRNAIELERKTCINDIDQGLIITNTKVVNMVISNIMYDSAFVSAQIVNFGLYHNQSFNDKFEAKIHFRKYLCEWLVEAIDFYPKDHL